MRINGWWWSFCYRWRLSSFLGEVMNSTYFKRFLSHMNCTACRQLLIMLPAHIDQCLLWTTEWIQSKKTKTDQLKRNGRNCKNVDILLYWCSTLPSSRPLPFIIDSRHRGAILSDPTQMQSVPSHFYSINKQLKAISDVLTEAQCWKFTTSRTWRFDR